ncbi:hypothetical protein [Streptomyces sp. LBL]|uniref:hypothetical protein n=1 Tax=Streptomyces sp. LBL TaxID=2940562 RepID=UPI0024739997|nr:hypothetical protein [Streptomyces sp. LBL]
MGSSMGQMRRHFINERLKGGADRAAIDRLEVAALAAVHRENESGGQARQVVADVARVLGVDIDEGPGNRWDPEHMARVIAVAEQVRDERDGAAEQAKLWKSLAERQDNTAPIRRDLREAERERDHWRSRYEGAQANALYVREQYGHPEEVDELKATIVRQAREITQLKGESE